MARSKVTITLDRTKADAARALIGSPSVSDAIDRALSQLIRVERLRRDVAAYRGMPLDAAEVATGDLPVELNLDDDDVDYDKLYAK